MDPLATLEDLEARGIVSENSEMLSALLDAASSSVRDAAGSPISRGTWTITWPGQPGQWTTVPIQPVVSVQNVKLDGVDVADCKLVGGRLWRRAGWANGCEPAEITATVTGGLDPVPADIVDLVCSMVGSALVRAEEGYRSRQDDPSAIRIDDYSEQYTVTADTSRIAGPLELPPATRDRLAARFGGGAVVVRAGR